MDRERAYAMERCPSVHGVPTAQESNPAPWTVDPQGAGSVKSFRSEDNVKHQHLGSAEQMSKVGRRPSPNDTPEKPTKHAL